MITKIKILIVDDEVLIAEHLKSVMQTFGCSNFAMAHSPHTALDLLKSYKPDIVFLDIRLYKNQEGIEIGERINQEFKIPFIYITAFSDSSIIKTALHTHPASFITKPYKAADIFAALSLVYINNPNLSKSYINFKYGNEYIKFPTHEIQLIERQGNYIKIHCATKKYLLRNSIEWMADKLPDDIFFRVHRSFLVNLRCIDKHTTEHISIHNIEIPISRRLKDALIEKIATL